MTIFTESHVCLADDSYKNGTLLENISFRKHGLHGIGSVFLILFSSACMKTAPPPNPKINPTPKSLYEIKVSISGFSEITDIIGDGQFAIQTEDCIRRAPISGARTDKAHSAPMPLTPQSDGSFVGRIYADYFLTEDYYGHGPCRWGITSVRATIRTSFGDQSAYLGGVELLNESSQINHCFFPTNEYVSAICRTQQGPNNDNDFPKNAYVVTMASRRIK